MHARTTVRSAGLLAAALCLLSCSCAGTSSAGSGGASSQSAPSSTAVSAPSSGGGASSGGPSTGTYMPAAGTASNGALLQTYTNNKLNYHMLVPGGWRVSTNHGIVRIAKLGNVIVIVSRAGKAAPKPKGVSTALDKQVNTHAILNVRSRPRTVDLPHAGKSVRVVFTKNQPATGTSPATTVVVTRYLLFHQNHVLILSFQSPATRHNGPVYSLLANSFTWDKGTGGT